MKCISLFLLLLIAAVDLAHAVECSSQRNTYQQLNAKILVRTTEDAKRVTPVVLADTRANLNIFLERDIRALLNNQPAISAEEIRRYIQCIQGVGRAEVENPSLPYVIQLKDTPNQLIVAYVINAGGEGIPDSLPFMALWSYEANEWKPRYVDLTFYLRSSFSLNLLSTADGIGSYLLASGKEYGDGASRLKLTLFRVKKNQIDHLWKTFDFNAGSFDISGDQIRIRYIPNRDKETYKTATYVISAKGIEPLPK
jgi:hypothetical protein